MSAQKNTETQIINGAVLHLQRIGPARPPYAGIAESSGVSRQLVRYYFPDPDRIVIDASDAAAQAYATALDAGLQNKSGADRLSFILDFFFDTLAGENRIIREECFDSLLALAISSKQLRDNLADKYTTFGDALHGELKAAHPSLSEAAASEVAYLCVSLLKGHWSMVDTLGFSKKHSAVARQAVDRLMASYLDNSTSTVAAGTIWSKD